MTLVTSAQTTPEVVGQLSPEQVSKILGLARISTRVDGVAPLSEQVLMAVRHDPATESDLDAAGPSTHFLVYAGKEVYAGKDLAGYAHLRRDASDRAATAELVVNPADRRRGVATALVHAIEAVTSSSPGAPRSLRLWSHGDLGGARALALRGGYEKVRGLWQMRRSLRPDVASLPAAPLPEGFQARSFVVGKDEEAWLRVNAQAFVDHPEQGRMTRSDLDQRIAEPWFDAAGFILVEDTRGLTPVLAASHWTKVVTGVDPDEGPPGQPRPAATEGEVYVVGVHPTYQGLGLGRVVTILGLEHLHAMGLSEAMLYVEADNSAAIATYTHLDFVRAAVDIMYSRTVHPVL